MIALSTTQIDYITVVEGWRGWLERWVLCGTVWPYYDSQSFMHLGIIRSTIELIFCLRIKKNDDEIFYNLGSWFLYWFFVQLYSYEFYLVKFVHFTLYKSWGIHKITLLFIYFLLTKKGGSKLWKKKRWEELKFFVIELS